MSCASRGATYSREVRRFLAVFVAAALLFAIVPQASAVNVGSSANCPVSPKFVKHDFRAMWIATVVNIDWPSRAGLNVERQKAELIEWLDLAQRNNFNAVVLQVRPAADAFWPSPYEPWSRWLGGRQGADPGYDPLAFAVEQAHARNIELHAWFNPYRVSMNTRINALSPNHPARKNPDWVVKKDGKLYYDPGIPEVRAFVVDAIMDAVTRYDIDGVHFDDYFYPYPGSGRPFQDTETYRKYGAGFANRGDWRRANVDALIKELSDRITATKPWVRFGVSPFAVWRNASSDPAGSRTRAGVQNYDQLYADTRKWVREGWIDYIAPQIYWTRGFTIADYEVIVPWWSNEIDVARANGHNVALYIGEATYRAGTRTTKDWRKRNVLARHRNYTRRFDQVKGAIYFSAKDVKADRRGTTSTLVKRYYSRPALPPVIGAANGGTPAPVSDQQRTGSTLRWTGADGNAASYAIYRVPGANPGPCDLADARNLVTTIRRTGAAMQWRDPAPQADTTYVITAVSREGRESAGVLIR